MFTLSGIEIPVQKRTSNIVPIFETVRHVAYKCGCVRSIRGNQSPPSDCPVHGDRWLSMTKEVVRRDRAPAA